MRALRSVGDMAVAMLFASTLFASTSSANVFIEVGPPSDRHQKPLDPPTSGSAQDDQLRHVGDFTKHRQDGTVCPTYGEAQWTGKAKVREGRELFYWFFDSRDNPKQDPIVIYLSGGPGGASVDAAVRGIGPCWLVPNTTEIHPTPWSWTRNASVLFLDSPAGAGFSTVAEGYPLPNTDLDAAKDFLTFLNIFFVDIFPDRGSRPIHLLGGSYFGHWGPVFLQQALRWRERGELLFEGSFDSLIMANSLFNWTATFVGSYDLLCKEREKVGWLNATACEAIADSLPKQIRLGKQCDLDYGGNSCVEAWYNGLGDGFAPVLELVKNKGLYLANINVTCVPIPEYPYCTAPNTTSGDAYMNQSWVKEAFGISPSYVYKGINMDVHRAYRAEGGFMAPRSHELADVLEGGVRVLVLNGNLDWLVNTPGLIKTYDDLEWSGQEDFKAGVWEPLPNGVDTDGTWKATGDGRLAFFALERGGHGAIIELREIMPAIAQVWFQGGWTPGKR